MKNFRREKVIFENLLKCTKCDKVLKFNKGKFSCGTNGCTKIGRDILMKKLIEGIVEMFVSTNVQKSEGIKEVTKALEKKINEKEQKLFKLINTQTKVIENYLADVTNEEIEKEIIIKVRCSYCHNLYNEFLDKCPHCGAKR